MYLTLVAAAAAVATPQSDFVLTTDGLPLRPRGPVEARDAVGPKSRDPRVVQPTASDFDHERGLPIPAGRRNSALHGADFQGDAGPKGTSASELRDRPFTALVFDDQAKAGTVFVRGREWKAAFSPQGLDFTPALGRAARVNQTFRFELETAAVGGEPLGVHPAAVSRNGDVVTLDRGALHEVFHLDLDTAEQTFVFSELPVRDELSVEIRVDAPWTPVVDGSALRFEHSEFGAVTYGEAFAVDAKGRRIPIAREWTGDSIRMVVPADFVQSAALPLVIDPPIGTVFFNGFGTTDDTEPDIAYDGISSSYWITWEDYTSATDADCYVSRFDASGLQGVTLAVDLSTDAWRDPAVAASRDADRVLVVAAVSPVGGGVRNIDGRYVDPTSSVLVGGPFNIDSLFQDCAAPDVGGTWTTSAGQSEFCVVWERIFSPTDHDILARLVDTDLGFGTSPIFLSNASADNDFAPAISQSQGDQAVQGDFWNIAWIRDDDGNGRGQPWTDRLYLDGTKNGSTQFLAFSTELASRVDVTSTMTEPLGDTGERPWIVSFYREVNSGDIYTTVCTQNASRGTNNLTELEDFDCALDQREPRIAGNGFGFLLTYSELYWGTTGTTDFDVYMVSGSIGESASGGYLALGERHENLAFSTSREFLSTVCTRFDGGEPGGLGMASWVSLVIGTSGGRLEAQELAIDFPLGSTGYPVGLQYCAANAHADSGANGRESSFITATGPQSVGGAHQLRCEDMKRNAFAYFICSRTVGDVNMPGGSAGRLCLGGFIGRVVGGQTLFTGNQGAVSVWFSPTNLPTPTGSTSAAPGETWSFQCWHRDVQGGVATSNFSNGCRIRFRP